MSKQIETPCSRMPLLTPTNYEFAPFCVGTRTEGNHLQTQDESVGATQNYKKTGN
jgi:hypothetical protein